MAGPMPAVPAWTITGQSKTMGLTPTGQATGGWNISYRTASGVTGQVFVPDSAFNTTTVKAMVSEAAAMNDAIAGLTP